MKKIIFSLAVIGSLSSCLQAQKSTKKESINNKTTKTVEIDSATVRKHLYTLASDEMEGRKPGTEGMEKATQYIEQEYKRIGLKTLDSLESYRQNFEYKGIKMSNIIGLLEGKSKKDEFVIVSAHHDHLGMKKDGEGDRIFNGANAYDLIEVFTLCC